MNQPKKITIHDLAAVDFAGNTQPTSRVVHLKSGDTATVWVVDMTKPASATVSIAGRSALPTRVHLTGQASSVVDVLSAMTRITPSLIRSMTVSISGAKPLGT